MENTEKIYDLNFFRQFFAQISVSEKIPIGMILPFSGKSN